MTQEHEEKRVPDPAGSLASNGANEELADVDYEAEDALGSVEAVQEAKLKKLREELENVKKERHEYLNGWQRCKADAINAKRDIAQMLEISNARTLEEIILRVIPVVDSFDMAIADTSWTTVDETWRKGVEGIAQQLAAALEQSGASYFGKAGERFDPSIHEVLQEVEGDGEVHTIARIIRRGWKLKERIVRPAQVAVFFRRS